MPETVNAADVLDMLMGPSRGAGLRSEKCSRQNDAGEARETRGRNRDATGSREEGALKTKGRRHAHRTNGVT